MKIFDVKDEGTVCPSQWFAKDEDGNLVYIRYRWGYLSVSYYGDDAPLKDKHIWGSQIGDSLDGYLTTEQMLFYITMGDIEWEK